MDITTETLRELRLLHRPAITPDSTATPPPKRRRHKQCARKQNRGKHACIRARLAASRTRPAIPASIRANVRSLDHKRLLRSVNRTVTAVCLFSLKHGLMICTYLPSPVNSPCLLLNPPSPVNSSANTLYQSHPVYSSLDSLRSSRSKRQQQPRNEKERFSKSVLSVATRL